MDAISNAVGHGVSGLIRGAGCKKPLPRIKVSPVDELHCPIIDAISRRLLERSLGAHARYVFPLERSTGAAPGSVCRFLCDLFDHPAHTDGGNDCRVGAGNEYRPHRILSMLALLFALLMRWLPSQRQSWRSVWGGAVL